MNKQDLLKAAVAYMAGSAGNIVAREAALSNRAVDMKIFDAPLLGFASADDEGFTKLKDPDVIGPHFLTPVEWLPEAKTVISFFLPFTELIRKSNQEQKAWPSAEWLHGRIEGHAVLVKLARHLQDILVKAGFKSVIPSLEAGFWSSSGGEAQMYTSNWSERHVAYLCGLGTFGLSKGLITRSGVAGRFGSIVTEAYFLPDQREYQDIYEYCLLCGACVKNCPVNAISLEKGKDHRICSKFLDKTQLRFHPRYGCGKCQTGVPCESGIPTPDK